MHLNCSQMPHPILVKLKKQKLLWEIVSALGDSFNICLSVFRLLYIWRKVIKWLWISGDLWVRRTFGTSGVYANLMSYLYRIPRDDHTPLDYRHCRQKLHTSSMPCVPNMDKSTYSYRNFPFETESPLNQMLSGTEGSGLEGFCYSNKGS